VAIVSTSIASRGQIIIEIGAIVNTSMETRSCRIENVKHTDLELIIGWCKRETSMLGWW